MHLVKAHKTIGPKTRIKRCDESAKYSGLSRLAPPSVFSTSILLSTIPSTINDTHLSVDASDLQGRSNRRPVVSCGCGRMKTVFNRATFACYRDNAVGSLVLLSAILGVTILKIGVNVIS